MEIFSLSAIDIFASAMGAFIVIAIVLMPYYQNEFRSQGDDKSIADFRSNAENFLRDAEDKKRATDSQMASLIEQIEQEQNRLMSLEAELASMSAVKPKEVTQEKGGPEESFYARKVDFRFLGIKTQKDDIEIVIDLHKRHAAYKVAILKTVRRILASLSKAQNVSILAYGQSQSGQPAYYRWPEGGGQRPASIANKDAATKFVEGLLNQFNAGSGTHDALQRALSGPAESIFLLSDGRPFPGSNGGRNPKAIVSSVTQANQRGKEIHAIAVGDYFQTEVAFDFLLNLASQNNGQFQAISPSG
ncbi:MAG: hypothetical protein AAF337_12080, partial [Pseudomonadota bacterium]